MEYLKFCVKCGRQVPHLLDGLPEKRSHPTARYGVSQEDEVVIYQDFKCVKCGNKRKEQVL